ncbi:MAG: class I adenylate cyclase [Succinivibrio sp.]|nr:class I adenylate cyclase [Succinivibrio sp.]
MPSPEPLVRYIHMTESTHKDFAERLKNYQAFNNARIQAALQAMQPSVRKFLTYLPILLHFNQPNIPGFRDQDIPYGIDGFIPDLEQIKILQKLGMQAPFQQEKANYSIYALYAMGSTSSIGQGPNSDLDIWVCISKDIPAHAVRALEEKCHFISKLAKSYGSDLNLFVTAEDRFTSGEHDTLDTDNCGSAQSLFLLDEFYRSSVRICGRYIVWYLVSPEEERENYAQAVNQLLSEAGIDRQDFFDFGSVLKSSPAEFFGSGLWLLYKGIDSPFKAVLKILLMESYAHEYPSTTLLSSTLKVQILRGEIKDRLQIDAYYLMYKKVSRYLKAMQDEERLVLLRACFSLKIFRSIRGLESKSEERFRMRLLQHMWRDWKWPSDIIDQLYGREHWKIAFVSMVQERLFKSLYKSYRTLLDFSMRHRIEYAITSDDAGVLSRKLYAAFDIFPSKINLLNYEMRNLLEEPALTFIKPHEGSVCRAEWHIYPAAADDLKIMRIGPAYIGRDLCTCVCWASFNHLMTDRTRCFIFEQGRVVADDKVKSLSKRLLQSLEMPELQVNESVLTKPRGMIKCAIVLNFEQDRTENLKISSSDLDYGSTLCCGRARSCLIGSIDVVILDTWGQLTSQILPSGEAGVVELLSMLLRYRRDVSSGEELLEKVTLLSFSKMYRDLIRYDLESLLTRVLCLQEQNSQDVFFEVGHGTYEARVSGERGVRILFHSMLQNYDFDIRVLSRYSMRPEFALQVPDLVEVFASLGVVQYFFAPCGERSWDIYVLNERNEVRTYRNFKGSRSLLVNDINRFYTRQTEDQGPNQSVHFNLPQYFVFSQDLKRLHPFTISSEQVKAL